MPHSQDAVPECLRGLLDRREAGRVKATSPRRSWPWPASHSKSSSLHRMPIAIIPRNIGKPPRRREARHPGGGHCGRRYLEIDGTWEGPRALRPSPSRSGRTRGAALTPTGSTDPPARSPRRPEAPVGSAPMTHRRRLPDPAFGGRSGGGRGVVVGCRCLRLPTRSGPSRPSGSATSGYHLDLLAAVEHGELAADRWLCPSWCSGSRAAAGVARFHRFHGATLPLLLLGPIGGSIADRFDRRHGCWLAACASDRVQFTAGTVAHLGRGRAQRSACSSSW